MVLEVCSNRAAKKIIDDGLAGSKELTLHESSFKNVVNNEVGPFAWNLLELVSTITTIESQLIHLWLILKVVQGLIST